MAKHITISVYIVKETFIHDIVTFAEDIVRKKVASRRILRPKDANQGGGHCKSRESNKDHYNDVALDTGFCNNLYSGIQRDKTKWKCVCELYHIDRLRRLS